MPAATSFGPVVASPAISSLAGSLAMALDPVRLARRARIDPDPWQRKILRSVARQVLLLCSRQSGKSTVSALLALDEALHRAPALVLILAPALRQSQELFRKIKGALNALGAEAPQIVQESTLSLELSSGSRILCLPGREDSTIRGFSSVSLLIVDEAARVRDDLYLAIRPMLAVSGGRIVALSTPFGKRGWFFQEVTTGGDAWERAIVTAYQCPRIDPAWLAQERATTADLFFRSEYLCEFVDVENQVFGYEAVMKAIDHNIAPRFPKAAA